MSVSAEIKILESDPNSLYKTQRIRFSSDKSIITPTKTIPLDRLKSNHPLNNNATHLNELFKRFSASQIKEAEEDADKLKLLENHLNRQKNIIKNDKPTYCFFDFNEARLPTDEETEFLTDLAYCNSDITTIPTISQFKDSKDSTIKYEDYKKYLESAIESIEQLNHKPIMGVIPRLSRKNTGDLLGFYNNKGINTFALDLGGSNPISSRTTIFKVLKTLNKMKILDESYIHGHNVGMRVNKITEVIPAKDVLGFGLGLNSLGEKRTEFKPNRAFISFIQTNPLNKFRLFNKTDYGYWKAISSEELEKVYPTDSSIPVSVFKQTFSNPTQYNYIQKAFNFEQLALEAHHIKEIISEDSEKTLEYITKKKNIAPDDVKIIETGQDNIKK